MTESISPPLPPHAPPGSLPRARLAGLDVLRGIAAMGIVISHYTSNYEREFKFHNGPVFDFPRMGLIIQLFFILSGFVILMTLEKTRRPRDFIRSRIARLYPAYWAAVILTFCILRLLPLHPLPHYEQKFEPTLARVLINLTMLQEMFGKGSVDSVYWTLQMELSFYFIMFVLFSCKQLRRAEYYLIAILAITELLMWLVPPGAPVWRRHPVVGNIMSDLQLLMVTGPRDHAYCHLPGFLIGVILYRLYSDFRLRHLWVLVGTLLWFAVTDWGMPFFATLAFTALVYAAARGWLALLENRAMLYLGFISYTLYLTHQSVGYEVISALERHGVGSYTSIGVAIFAAVVVASLLTYCIEQPALRLLRPAKAAKPSDLPLSREKESPRPSITTPRANPGAC